MLSLHGARDLLSSASTPDHLAAIARALGVAGTARALDHATREAIGIPPDVVGASICRGPGCSRALLLEVRRSTLREALTHIASQLSTRAPQLLWLLIAMDAERRHVAVAAFTSDRHPPRTRALLCERDNVLDSDAETLCALASVPDEVDVMLHYRWTEILGREALTRRFYTNLERVVETLASSAAPTPKADDARELALLYVSRLLFLSFLETQGWLNGDHGFLANGFADCMAGGGRYHRRVLLPLFFGTLNTPLRSRSARARAFGRIPFLNGGLFSRSPVERRSRHIEFSDESMGVAFGELFCRHRFTPREDSGEWSEAAVDPEMLGKAFESLMSSRDRKSSGAFYTPQPLVERVLREGVAHALRSPTMSEDEIHRFLAARAVPAEKRGPLLARVRSVRVLDPACGSGAFLVFALGELSWLAAACGDGRPRGEITRAVLTGTIFGVDVNPTAVWLCELRLWLAMVMEQRDEGIASITPLPNLDRQIRVGDTLTGGSFGAGTALRASTLKLRTRYSRAHGPRKKALARALDRAERSLSTQAAVREMDALHHARRELLIAARTRDFFGERHQPAADTRRALAEVRASLRELRKAKRDLEEGCALPFSFDVQFAEIAGGGGFDLVVGNPPWVRLHRVPPLLRARLRAEFAVFRSSAWLSGANSARAGSGFGSQVDMSALFVERSLQLLRPGGVLALLLPAKLWSSLAGGGVRNLLRREAAIHSLEDLSNAPVVFDAAAYPSLLIARKTAPASEPAPAHFAVHRHKTVFAWRSPRNRIALDDTTGSPWIIVPPDVRAAFDRLRSAAVPLCDTRIGRPMLGMKSGCNEAFVVTAAGDARPGVATIRSGEHTGEIDRGLLRPAVKGEQISPWRCERSADHVLWTHGPDGRALKVLPADCRRWLGNFRARLDARTDGRNNERWWSLFRTDGALCDLPRVVWADIGKRPRAAVLPAGDNAVPLNTCYVVRCRDEAEALSLAAILNSDLAAAWLNIVAEPARGGYHRYLGWTVSLLPLPRDWTGACALLPKVARDVMSGGADSSALLDAVLTAYGVRFPDVAPLLAWSS